MLNIISLICKLPFPRQDFCLLSFFFNLLFLSDCFLSCSSFCLRFCLLLCNPSRLIYRFSFRYNLGYPFHKLRFSISITKLIPSYSFFHVRSGKGYCFIRNTDIPAIYPLQAFYHLFKRIYSGQHLVNSVTNQFPIRCDADTIAGIFIHKSLFHPVIIPVLLGKQIHLFKPMSDTAFHHPLLCIVHHLSTIF